MKFAKKSFSILLSLGLLITLSLSLAGCTPEVKESKIYPAVSNLTATAGKKQVSLSWTNPTSEELVSLEVKYGQTEFNFTKTISVEKAKTSYTVTDLAENTKYYFCVSAVYADAKKDSAVVSATTPKESSGTQQEETSLSSVDFAKAMAIGWNLGNTLDASTETGWGMPLTTEEMIKAVHAAGFKTIRIPVSWSNHVSGSDYTIDSTWLNRVKTVVDWAINDGMYVIINIHHDNYSISNIKNKSGFALSDDQTIQTKSKKFISSVWTQVGNTFKDYDEKLVFEVLNEPRCVGEETEWWTNSAEMIAVITDYEQTAVDAIRATGGKNANRYLMVPGYAASGSDSGMLSLYKMPDDSTAKDKLILSTHAYSPYNFAMNNMDDTTFDTADEKSLDSIFSFLKKTYIDKGIGIVMGEASASDKNNTDERIKWTKYYFGKAKECGIPVVLWDNMVLYKNSKDPAESHGYFDRLNLKWYFPEIISAAMETVGITDFSTPEYVAPTVESIGWKNTATTNVISNPGALKWDSSANNLSKSKFANAKAGSILKISFTAPGANIKIINPNWTTYSKGTIFNGSAASDGVITTSDKDLYYVLTADDAAAFKANDITIAGQKGTITAAYFQE